MAQEFLFITYLVVGIGFLILAILLVLHAIFIEYWNGIAAPIGWALFPRGLIFTDQVEAAMRGHTFPFIELGAILTFCAMVIMAIVDCLSAISLRLVGFSMVFVGIAAWVHFFN